MTSSMAAASMLTTNDSPVMVVGEEGIVAAIVGSGLEITSDPERSNTVMVGLNRTFDYRQMTDAARAIRNGARFIATNSDPTFPTSTGLDPGSGAIVQAISTASGVEAEIAGKPHQVMVDMLLSRGIEKAWVIGDRLDTDIALAAHVRFWMSILVMSGVTTPDHPEVGTADYQVADINAAVDLVLQAD